MVVCCTVRDALITRNGNHRPVSVAVTVMYDSFRSSFAQVHQSIIRCLHTPDPVYRDALSRVPGASNYDHLNAILESFTYWRNPSDSYNRHRQSSDAQTRPGSCVLLCDLKTFSVLFDYLRESVKQLCARCSEQIDDGVFTDESFCLAFPGISPNRGHMMTDSEAMEWIRHRFIAVRLDNFVDFVFPSASAHVTLATRYGFICATTIVKLLTELGLNPMGLAIAEATVICDSQWERLVKEAVDGTDEEKKSAVDEKKVAFADARTTQLDMLTGDILTCQPLPSDVIQAPIPRLHVGRNSDGEALYLSPSQALPESEAIHQQTTDASSRFIASHRAGFGIEYLCVCMMALQGIAHRVPDVGDILRPSPSGNSTAGENQLGEYQTIVTGAKEAHLDQHVQQANAILSKTLSGWAILLMSLLQYTIDEEAGRIPHICSIPDIVNHILTFCCHLCCVLQTDLNLQNPTGTSDRFDQRLFKSALDNCSFTRGSEIHDFMSAFCRHFYHVIKTARVRNTLHHPTADGVHTSTFLPPLLPSDKLDTEPLLEKLSTTVVECLKMRREAVLVRYLIRTMDVNEKVTAALARTINLNARDIFVAGCGADTMESTQRRPEAQLTAAMQGFWNDSSIGGLKLSGSVLPATPSTCTPDHLNTPYYSYFTFLRNPVTGDKKLLVVCVNCMFTDDLRTSAIAQNENFVPDERFTNVLFVVLCTSEEGATQYREQKAAMKPERDPPQDSLTVVTDWRSLLRNPTGGPAQTYGWYTVADFDFAPRITGVVSVRFIWNDQVYSLSTVDPLGVFIRVISFTVQTGQEPGLGGLLRNPPLFLRRAYDDIREFPVFTDDTCLYGNYHYSELVCQAFQAIRHRFPNSQGPIRSDDSVAVNIPFDPNTNTADMIDRLRHLKAPFLRDILTSNERNGFIPTSVRFITDMTNLRDTNDWMDGPARAHRRNRTRARPPLGNDPPPDNACTFPIPFMFGIQGQSLNEQPPFRMAELANALPHSSVIAMCRQRVMYVIAVGGCTSVPQAITQVQQQTITRVVNGVYDPNARVLRNPHLTNLIHADVGRRFRSVFEFMGLFHVINNPNTHTALSRPLSPLGPSIPPAVADPLNPHLVCVMTVGAECAKHQSRGGHGRTVQHTFLDMLFAIYCASFASSTHANPTPICVLIPPEAGTGIKNVGILRKKIRLRWISLLATAYVQHPLYLVTHTDIKKFVDTHIMPSCYITSDPRGRVENGVVNLQVNFILDVGGFASTIEGANRLRSTRTAADAPSGAFGGYPCLNDRALNHPLLFRVCYVAVRGRTQHLLLSGSLCCWRHRHSISSLIIQ